jgi:hypothetical protein
MRLPYRVVLIVYHTHRRCQTQAVAQGGVIPAGAHLVQPYCTIKARSGKEPVGEVRGQGAGEDLPIGVVLHAAYLSTGGIAHGHGAAQVVLVDVVEAAVRAGGEALALSPNPGSYLTSAPDPVIMSISRHLTERTSP